MVTLREISAARGRGETATYEPQGLCPNAWVARVNGEPLRTSKGGMRRYASVKAALKAAKAATAP